MKRTQPSFLQAMMLIMLSVGLISHVLIIPALLAAAKRDSWISVLLSAGPFLIFALMLAYVSRFLQHQTLHEWLTSRLGKPIGMLFRVGNSLFFLSAIYFTLHDTTTWAKTNYLTETPILVTSIALMSLCAYGAYKGIRSLAFTAGLILPLVVLLGFYVAIVNTQYKDYSRLLPVLEHGWHPVLNGMIYSLAGMFELLFIWYIQPHLTKRIRVWQYLMLALILVGLTVGPLIGAIVEFDPFEAAKMRYPAFEEWRIASLGKYIAQTDFFSIYQWLAGSFTRISLAMYIVVEIWNIKSSTRRLISCISLGVFFILTMLYPLDDMTFEKLLVEYIFPFNLVYLSGLAIIATTVAFIHSRHQRRKHHGASSD
ncbi:MULTISPECIES: GerAB/ArcD/ProY family transporter [Paenibacillus]|uniref:Spore germination protein (Amino acid permease) n=1 Tax=Paenibacillus xylanexedens TaxID=528191 RepID=A0ABS4S298_PAEXY|nr:MULTISPECIES: endospore germination permease [Paenibacillus]MBP2248816.1 spore germination protein (amino acid permease) [Paenibacillus xylanexedens]